jgi:hypothetical protein
MRGTHRFEIISILLLHGLLPAHSRSGAPLPRTPVRRNAAHPFEFVFRKAYDKVSLPGYAVSREPVTERL